MIEKDEIGAVANIIHNMVCNYYRIDIDNESGPEPMICIFLYNQLYLKDNKMKVKEEFEKKFAEPLIESGIAEIFTRYLWSWIEEKIKAEKNKAIDECIEKTKGERNEKRDYKDIPKENIVIANAFYQGMEVACDNILYELEQLKELR